MPVFDQGYHHWRGPLTGHLWRWLAIARHGARVQLRGKVVRPLVFLAWVPALALVVALAVWGLVEQQSESVLSVLKQLLPPEVLVDPRAYRTTAWTLAYSFFFKAEMPLIMLLVAVAGPGLISADLRFNALPLYLSRPLTRLDYFLGKLGVIGALVALVAVGPAVGAYLVGVCFSFDVSVVKDTYRILLAAVAYGLVVTLSTGTLVLAMSSLTRRSLYVGIAWAGLWLISAAVGTAMAEIHRASVRWGLVDEDLTAWVASHPPPPGTRMYRAYPGQRYDYKTGQPHLDGIAPGHEAEGDQWLKAWTQAWQRAQAKGQAREAEAVRRDWRPLCSYGANMERIADQLFDTDAAWVAVGRAVEKQRRAVGGAFGVMARGGLRALPPSNERQLADRLVWQYPWEWSAGVLAGLVGLSSWTLTRRVRSLDRLR